MALFCFSCTKVLQDKLSTKVSDKSISAIKKKISDRQLDFEWLGATAKIKYADDENQFSFVANIRMKKDSIFWLRLKKLNIEGARVRISKDSIEVLDRQNKTYEARPLNQLNEQFGLTLNLLQLQQLVIGNSIFDQQAELIVKQDSGQYYLGKKAMEDFNFYYLIDPNTMRINSFHATKDGYDFKIDYEDYNEIDQNEMPHTLNINILTNQDKKITAQIQFTKIVINEIQKTGFVVPEDYGRN